MNQLSILREFKTLTKLTLNVVYFGLGSTEEIQFFHEILRANPNIEDLTICMGKSEINKNWPNLDLKTWSNA